MDIDHAAQHRGIDLVDQSDEYQPADVRVLIDGPATFSAMYEALGSAKSYIYIETYVFEGRGDGFDFVQPLVDRAQAGVTIYLNYDAFGSIEVDADIFTELHEAGVLLCEYNSLTRFEARAKRSVNVRNHRKIMVVDGAVAFIGGVNLCGEYAIASADSDADDPVSAGWRDTHLQLRGPVVTELARAFEDNWTLEPRPCFSTSANARPDATDSPVRVAIRSASGDDESWSAIRSEYLRAIQSARHRIWLTQAYFVPDRLFLGEIVAASRRGVDVRMILPGVSDSYLVIFASRTHYTRLLRAGVRIFEFRKAVVHAKTAVADGHWSTVGSSNIDFRSFVHNNESNAIIISEAIASQLEEQFLQDQQRAEEIILDRWLKRSSLMRIRERCAKLVEYWI